jgi:hypothetical protein
LLSKKGVKIFGYSFTAAGILFLLASVCGKQAALFVVGITMIAAGNAFLKRAKPM